MKCSSDVRLMVQRQPRQVAIDQYAEAASGNREYFLKMPHNRG